MILHKIVKHRFSFKLLLKKIIWLIKYIYTEIKREKYKRGVMNVGMGLLHN